MSTRPESMRTVEFGYPGRFVDEDAVDLVPFHFEPTRREVVGALGAGLLIAVMAPGAGAQQRQGGGQGRGGGRGGGGPRNLAARIHIARDGTITVMTGKVEGGQGARAQLTQAAAEELRVPVERVKLIMADTLLVPDDGITAGSRSTPSTVPSIRQGAAAARNLLIDLAAKKWNVDRSTIQVRDGQATNPIREKHYTYADLAGDEAAQEVLAQPIPRDITLTPIPEWKTLGTAVRRPNARDLVTGGHQFPSDIRRPGMLYGKVLRPATYGATRTATLAPAKAMKDVAVVQDGDFVGVAAPTSYAAEQALAAVAKTVTWQSPPHVSSKDLYSHLRDRARGGLPANPFAEELGAAAKKLKQPYQVAYAQHAPMEPRAAVAEWEDGKLTVWTATQNPFGVRGELVRAFRLSDDRVRVIVPDFGGGFGGKHSGECAVEAARLAQGAGKPVSLRWTRQEEFTFAYFRPAAVIEAEATLDVAGKLTSWHFLNINSGPSAIETPYNAGKSRSQFIASEAPLRHGSYRALASTANTFARECFMDELAAAAGADPLEFRLKHLENPRLRAVLESAAEKFDWKNRVRQKDPKLGVGLACGTEKGSFVAACVEVEVDADELYVRRVVQSYECGKVLNPENVLAQVQGAIIQGLGPALREEVRFEGGKVQSDNFSRYPVPRFKDVPKLEVHLLDRPDLPSVGAGETPIIAVAPAIANAVFHATGVRVRQMPVRLPRG